MSSPDRIRTGATALRGRRPGPLDDGAPETSVLHRGKLATRESSAGVPGLEPRLTEPESVGLPITPYPKGCDPSDDRFRADDKLYRTSQNPTKTLLLR